MIKTKKKKGSFTTTSLAWAWGSALSFEDEASGLWVGKKTIKSRLKKPAEKSIAKELL